MDIAIIGAGYGRTGTMSTQIALNLLGFPCYHAVEAMNFRKNAGHLGFWRKVAETPPGTQHDWQKVFENYRATIDFPASCVWRELMEVYPEAKVLLTLHPRGAEAWYESTLSTIYRADVGRAFKILEKFIPPMRQGREMITDLVWQRTLHGTMDDRPAAIAQYQKHVEEVKSAVPAEKLLVYSVDQGWGPLCEFLGVDVPDMEFPSVNDRAAMKRRFAMIRIAGYAVVAAGAAAAAGLVYLAIRVFT